MMCSPETTTLLRCNASAEHILPRRCNVDLVLSVISAVKKTNICSSSGIGSALGLDPETSTIFFCLNRSRNEKRSRLGTSDGGFYSLIESLVPFVTVMTILNVDLGELDHFIVEMSRWSSTIVDEVFDFIVGLIGWNRPEATIVAHFLEGPTQLS
eukprot:CCRYP_008323-RB/>CCRYP_008323-RB protein AED:0.22 eAED:0.39 QI:1542/0/0.5/1/0/0/2/0/154